MKSRELTPEEAQYIVSEKRHNELNNTLKSLGDVLTSKDTDVKKVMDKQTEIINKFIETMESFKKELIFPINNDNSEEKVVNSIREMTDSLNKGLTELKSSLIVNVPEQKKEWTFTVKRDSNGFIQSITAS